MIRWDFPKYFLKLIVLKNKIFVVNVFNIVNTVKIFDTIKLALTTFRNNITAE